MDAERSVGPTKRESTPGTAAISSTASSASRVSICTARNTSSADAAMTSCGERRP
jgi:hypothetical protein